MTYMHRGNCRSSVCRSKGGRPQVVQVVYVVQVVRMVKVVQMVQVVSLDDMYSENIWFTWSKL